MRPRSKAVAELLRWVRPTTLPCAWRWLQLEGRFRAEVSEKAVTNGTFHLVWTRARVRLWPPRPKTSIAACSVICRRKSAIAKSIAVPARDKLTFACAATAFTTALHADRLAGTGFRTRVAHALTRLKQIRSPVRTSAADRTDDNTGRARLESCRNNSLLRRGLSPLQTVHRAHIIPFPVSRAGRDPLRTLGSRKRTPSPLPGPRVSMNRRGIRSVSNRERCPHLRAVTG